MGWWQKIRKKACNKRKATFILSWKICIKRFLIFLSYNYIRHCFSICNTLTLWLLISIRWVYTMFSNFFTCSEHFDIFLRVCVFNECAIKLEQLLRIFSIESTARRIFSPILCFSSLISLFLWFFMVCWPDLELFQEKSI